MTHENSPDRHRILVVDDNAMTRAMLVSILEEEYEILEADDGDVALEILAESHRDIDLVMLDINMPRVDGFAVLEEMGRNRWLERCPVIVISGQQDADAVHRGYELGVTDYIPRDYDAEVVCHRARNTIGLADKQHDLMAMISFQMFRKERSSNLMVQILSHIVESHNGESGLHVVHIGLITDILLEYLAERTDRYDIPPKQRATITTASALHDIGKITVPSEVINKPGRLTDEEFAIMKGHSAAGAEMLADLTLNEGQGQGLVRCAHDIARWHHERWDGRGYPDGLEGDQIPISAQVVSLADVYDALTSERVYKPAFSHEKALEMIQNGECGQFNPLLLECLSAAADDIRRELEGDASASLGRREMRGALSELRDAEFLSETDRDEMIEEIMKLMDDYGAELG